MNRIVQDSTWCTAEGPKSIPLGTTLELRVAYRNVPRKGLLIATLLGRGHAETRTLLPHFMWPEVKGSGSLEMAFDVPEDLDRSITQLRFHAYVSRDGSWEERVTRLAMESPIQIAGRQVASTDRTFVHDARTVWQRLRTWRPQVGDPTFTGWFLLVVHLMTASLCALLTWNLGRQKQRTFWFLLTLLMFFLSLNKQLDLHRLATFIVRDLALERGFYDVRDDFARTVIVWLATIGFACLLFLLHRASSNLRGTWPALLGLALLGLFVLVRAIAFHETGQMFGLSITNETFRTSTELGGSLLIAFAAFKEWRQT